MFPIRKGARASRLRAHVCPDLSAASLLEASTRAIPKKEPYEEEKDPCGKGGKNLLHALSHWLLTQT